MKSKKVLDKAGIYATMYAVKSKFYKLFQKEIVVGEYVDNCKFCGKPLHYLQEENFTGYAETCSQCLVCDEMICEGCSRDEDLVELVHNSSETVCKGECYIKWISED